eukprot:CAMPEP_0181337860 /NCGR_PEP_ID=MMETSP1101-20121128/28286_1 /TAXON_ID=46948 /ORGANISM="Rhodomonas abbreviata, Strain Caron Lab Isolate" /LENGTH=106 /DNA_ID=CAMNT_0023448467 /DNA_START=187 /DNA_END=507 /DNA_ORIENTATION=+
MLVPHLAVGEGDVDVVVDDGSLELLLDLWHRLKAPDFMPNPQLRGCEHVPEHLSSPAELDATNGRIPPPVQPVRLVRPDFNSLLEPQGCNLLDVPAVYDDRYRDRV